MNWEGGYEMERIGALRAVVVGVAAELAFIALCVWDLMKAKCGLSKAVMLLSVRHH